MSCSSLKVSDSLGPHSQLIRTLVLITCCVITEMDIEKQDQENEIVIKLYMN